MGKKNKKFVIISGGSIQDAFAGELLRDEEFDVILAADSGMEFLKREDIVPDVIIGDFDSVKAETLEFFQKYETVEFHQLNPIKDDTDTEYAIRYAIAHGASEITLLGATGTRMDHVLGNISLLGIGLEQKVPITILDANNRIRMADHSLEILKTEQFGKYVSLIPYSEKVTGLTLKGMKYPLDHYELGGFNSLGVSNEIVDHKAEIIFESGILIVIESID
ncbi:MAG: thiamine diphosphokinase [Roseburia sp.]|nr:thiamine diphosphokinase [Roseburia sp.]